MKIEIESMILTHFKNVRKKKIEFTHNMLISGGNKVGKTTIYDAYLWCIFGITSRKGCTIQPLDCCNNVIHNLITSVSVRLVVNNSKEIMVERRLYEKYKNKGLTNEELIGCVTEYSINEVSLTKTEFVKKLNELCNYKLWLLLSNINLFMSAKVEERRDLLMSIVNDSNNNSIIKKYTILYEKSNQTGQSVDDIVSRAKSKKTQSELELKKIPLYVDILNSLRINTRKDEVDSISQLIALCNNNIENYEGEKYLSILDDFYHKRIKARDEWESKRDECLTRLFNEKDNFHSLLQEREKESDLEKEKYIKNKSSLDKVEEEYNKYIKALENDNKEKFNVYRETDTHSICGNSGAETINLLKSERLKEIQNKISELHQRIIFYKGKINAYKQIIEPNNKSAVDDAKMLYDQKVKELSDFKKNTWEGSSEKRVLDEEFLKLKKSPISVIHNDKEKTKKLIQNVVGQEINKIVDARITEYRNSAKELAQIVSDCENILEQAKEYQIAKLTSIENNINKYFNCIKWRFSKENLSNDNEKTICTAVDKNGIDFNNLNDGAAISMGVDIIKGLSKAFDVYVPLFIDRKESVEHIESCQQQTIYLQCVYNQKLKIQSL